MKKKHVLLMGILISTSVFASGFRNVEWGEGYKKIQQQEKSKKLEKTNKSESYGNYNWENTIYSFKDDLKSAGKFDVSYTLLKDKLIKGSYSQKIENSNLDNYEKMRKILIDKYGQIQNRYSSSYYENDGKKETKSNKETSVWYSEKMKIELSLVDNEKFEINYYTLDKKMLDFIKDIGLEKQREKEEKLLEDSDYIKKLI